MTEVGLSRDISIDEVCSLCAIPASERKKEGKVVGLPMPARILIILGGLFDLLPWQAC